MHDIHDQDSEKSGISDLGAVRLSDVIWIPLLALGGALLALANETPDALFMAMIILALGSAITALCFPTGRPERRAFLLAYSACALTAGVSQYYSITELGSLQSTFDAGAFYKQISPSPPFTTMADIPINFNAPLAVLIWQQAYAFAWLLGFKFGPYTGVLINAMTIGFTGALTVRVAREIFGDDAWRLNRIGIFFAWCGMFWLFGAVLIRDCFTLLLNTLTLWALVRWLCHQTQVRFITMLLTIAVSSYAMLYLREKTVVLFGLFGALAIFCWYWQGRVNYTRMTATILLPIVFLIGYVYFENYVQTSLSYQSAKQTSYLSFAASSSREDSLAMQLVVNQPLPIRLILGSGSMIIFPIPLWGYLKSGVSDYHLIKSCHGFYQVIIFPLIFFGGWRSLRETLYSFKSQALPPSFFIVAYALISIFSVAATSLETRHLAQFFPAFLVLASIPDTRISQTRHATHKITLAWFMFVILIHFAWAFARL